MSPRPVLATLLCLLFSTILFAQNKNPFESIGKKGKILTLSKGQYEELFDQDSIQQIGTTLVNVRLMKVVKLLKDEEVQKLLDNSSNSRFLSVDPLTYGYPELTPYQFASNRPIDGIDLDGLEYAEAKWTFDVFVKPFLNFGYGSVEYARGSVQKATAQTHQASYQNSSVPQHVQDRLAKQDIAEGTSKQINGTTEMVVATAEVTSTYAPLGAEAMLAVKAPRLAAKPAKWVLRAAVEETPRPFGYEAWGSETIGNGVRTFDIPPTTIKSNATTIVEEGNVRVGRWMSETEYQTMKATGRVQEGAGGKTSVATGGVNAFPSASKGSIYVEFDVPANSLIQGGKPSWFSILGPNASKSQLFMLKKQGGEILPEVKNLSEIIQKK